MSSKPSNPSPDKPVFIYDTHGDWQATRIGRFIFSSRGEYVGYAEGEDVYKQDGEWLGRLSKDGRILRKRTERRSSLHPNPPAKPPKPTNLPARAPLPPMMAELTYSIVDVLEEDPDIFKRISDLRPDIE
jgi:hypothetical protein